MTEQEIRADERRKIWEEINSHIKTGQLDGYEAEIRNGLILATNLIMMHGVDGILCPATSMRKVSDASSKG